MSVGGQNWIADDEQAFRRVAAGDNVHCTCAMRLSRPEM